MTSTPFADSRQKIRRAEKHLRELEENIQRYFAGDWYTLDYGGNPLDIKGVHLTMHGRPEDFSVIFGDVIHNLRAALDLMASEVVAANKGNPAGVYFPFCEDEQSLDKMIKSKKFDRASSEAVRELKQLKPYRGGNVALRALHDLDIQDKHRALVPTAIMISTPPIGPLLDDQGHPVGFAENDLKLTIDLSVSPEVTFTFPADSPLAEQEIVPTLHQLVETVSRILDTFEAVITP